MDQESKKYKDIIDAEFVSDSSEKKQENNKEIEKVDVAFQNEKFENPYTNSDEQKNKNFGGFYWSSNSKSLFAFKNLSFMQIVFMIPIFLFILSIIIVFGLLTLVIFLPKILLLVKRKGISGLKLDYKNMKELFGRFKMK